MPSSSFTGVVSPSPFAQSASCCMPSLFASASAVFTAGMFIELTSAVRSVTSPLKSSP